MKRHRLQACLVFILAAAAALHGCSGCGDYNTNVDGDAGQDGDAGAADDGGAGETGEDGGDVPADAPDDDDGSDVVIPADSGYPKTFIMIWGNASAAWFAEFDLAITQDVAKANAAKVINPGLLVAYICDINECTDCGSGNGCGSEWCVRKADGSILEVDPDSHICLGDTSDLCDENEGKKYRKASIEKAVEQVTTPNPQLDGWVSGGFWEGIGWFSSDYDLDGDGEHTSTDEQLWQDGRINFLRELRDALGPDKFIIMNNGGLKTYWDEGQAYINGGFAEMFMYFSRWPEFLEKYQTYTETGIEPHMTVIDNHARGDPDEGARSKNNFRFMRFGLAATLLYDGYYGYKDAVGTRDIEFANEHHYNRYYDEFDVPLGEPLASNIVIKDEVFCRFFEGGAMILNGSAQDYTVTEDELKVAAAGLGLEWDTIAGHGGHYYRFAGQQNPGWNDGSQFDDILLESRVVNDWWWSDPSRKGDGILLVRRPGQVVMADVIIDTEDFVTSPGAENAVLDGFTQSCDFADGFRTGGASCNDTTHPYKGHARAAAGSGATASFEALLVNEGVYRVYEYHPAVNGSDILFTVVHADGEETITRDQSTDAEQWNLLGEYRFAPDAPARVIVDTAGAAGEEVAADAVKFEWAGP
ncbi:MAG: putative glycoside hydrolase [Pseudomonadota bacterium]